MISAEKEAEWTSEKQFLQN